MAGPFELYPGGMGVVWAADLPLGRIPAVKATGALPSRCLDVPEIFDKANREGMSGETMFTKIAPDMREDGKQIMQKAVRGLLPGDAIYVDIRGAQGCVWTLVMA